MNLTALLAGAAAALVTSVLLHWLFGGSTRRNLRAAAKDLRVVNGIMRQLTEPARLADIIDRMRRKQRGEL